MGNLVAYPYEKTLTRSPEKVVYFPDEVDAFPEKVENTEITVVSVQNGDYISLTDMAHSQMQEHIVFRWMSLKSTIEYLGEWEMLYNPNFNCTEFDTIRNAAGSNNFVLSVKAWIERTGAIG